MKKYFLLFFLCMLTTMGYAQKEVKMYIEGSYKVKPGEQVVVPIQVKNNFEMVGLQFKVVLPDGVTLVENEDEMYCTTNSNRIPRKYTIGETPLSPTIGNGISFTFESDGSVPIKGESGEICTLTFKVDESAALGNLTVKFADILFQYMDGDIPTDFGDYDNFDLNLQVYETYSISAVSADETMGSVTLTNGGEAVENGTELTAQATAIAGYSFVNWTSGETEVSNENPYKFTAEANTSLTANFKANMYDVTFDVDGQKKTSSQAFGSVITAPEVPTKTGYTFAGWSPAFVEGAKVPVDGITYTATWTINQYTITFDTDGGSEVAAITQDYASAVTVPAAPTKTGYTFKGWDKEIPATMPAENVTIKAQWQINQYTVKFVADGEELKSETLDYNSAITAPADPVKEGYTFMGWDPSYVDGAKVPANDVTYTAVWKSNQYTITFDTDGGSEVAAITQDYATAVTAPADPTKTGYTFKGWDKEIPATMPDENVTIKAQWQINQYTVKFVADGAVVSETTLDYGTAITAPKAPAKEGYTFTGWSPEVDETVPANDVTYEAEYTINTYKLTYVLDDVEVKTLEVEYGAKIEDFVPEVEDGREFAGWEEVPATMPAHDVTIYGSTTIATFISAHFADSGKSVTVYTLNGTRVMTLEKASDIKRLTRGTYIINGRKVNIRE